MNKTKTLKKNILSLVICLLIVTILFFFTNGLYFLDATKKYFGLTLNDFGLACTAIITILAITFNKIPIPKLLKSYHFLLFIISIPFLVLISSIAGKFNFEQSLWTGLRPQRFLLLFPFIYLSLVALVKNDAISLKSVKITCIVFSLIYCSLGIVQLLLKDKFFFLQVRHVDERGIRIIMASAPVFLGASLLIGEIANAFKNKFKYKAILLIVGFVYLCLFDLLITRYRIYIITYIVATLACFAVFFSRRKPNLFKKIYPCVLGFFIVLVIGAAVFLITNLITDGSILVRFNGYFNYLSIFSNYPFAGIGFPSELNLWSKLVARLSNRINYVDIGLVGFIGLYGLVGVAYYCLFFYLSALFIRGSKRKNNYLLFFTLAFYLFGSLTVIPYFCDQNIIIACILLSTIECEEFLYRETLKDGIEMPKNTKVVMIGPKVFPSRVGGIDIVVEKLSRELVKEGNDVVVYAHKRGIKERELDGIQIKKIFRLNLGNLAAVSYSFFATLKALFSDADIIHFHGEGVGLFLWMTRFTSKKIVVTIHGLDWKRGKFKGTGSKVLLLSEKRIVKYADELIVLSQNDHDYFLEKYNKKSTIIPNGFDAQKLLKPNIIKTKYGLEKDSYFLFLARIVPEKGLHYLIEAYKSGEFKHKLVISGSDSNSKKYFDEMKELAKDNPNIIFTGFVSGDELHELYSNAFVYILPSDIEGMAMSLIEALGHKKVCLVSNIPENKISRENLIYFEKSSVPDLAKKLKELDDKEVSFKETKDFMTWSDIAKKNEEIYKDKKKYDYVIVGSGLYGSVCARELTDKGYKVLVVEKRGHLGGNIYTERVKGIDIHKYGAHIFHTSNERVWNYVNKFAEFNNFVNTPKANYKGEIYSLPFNMNTFSELWKDVKTAEDAKKHIEEEKSKFKVDNPSNLEEQAISLVGSTIYEKLIRGYTAKQWGRDCKDLPAFIIKRIPVRYEFNNNYFNDIYQGIPTEGYTHLIEKLLERIEVRLDYDFFAYENELINDAEKIIYTGPIDRFFNYKYGNLEYRKVEFKEKTLNKKYFQTVAVTNYTDSETPYTRIIEHKHFNFNENPKFTVISYEYPSEWKLGDEPYYPINNERNSELLAKYQDEAKSLNNIIFGGRLGEYRYYDMDKVVEKALMFVDTIGKKDEE